MATILRTHTPDTFFTTALPALEEIIYSRFEKWPDLIPLLASYKTGTGWGEQYTEQSGVGAAVEIPEGGSVTYDDIVQGNSMTLTYTKFGIGVKISEEMIDDQKNNQIGDIYASMGDGFFHTRQQTFFDNFNNGFATNGYDGVPLFSVSHPLVKAGGVQANRPSAAVDLTEASLRAALTDIGNWLTHEGLHFYSMPEKVLVSTTNIYDAIVLTKSDLRPGTANHDTNALTRWNLEPVMSPYLTDTDAWFVKCNEHKLIFSERTAPTMKSFEDFDEGAVKTKITGRFDTDHASWFGWYGSPGI